MTREGIPIQEMRIANPVQTRIEYGGGIPGCIPLYIEREAARFSLYNWSDWCGLDPMERATCVAHYWLHGLVKLHTEDAIARKVNNIRPPSNQGARP